MSSGSQVAMDPNISKLLDEIPERPPRSKLEVHADVIAALRQKRRTYSEIAEFFREHLAITVAPSTIHDFVRVRRRRRKRNTASPGEPHIGKPRDDAAPPVKHSLSSRPAKNCRAEKPNTGGTTPTGLRLRRERALDAAAKTEIRRYRLRVLRTFSHPPKN